MASDFPACDQGVLYFWAHRPAWPIPESPHVHAPCPLHPNPGERPVRKRDLQSAAAKQDWPELRHLLALGYGMSLWVGRIATRSQSYTLKPRKRCPTNSDHLSLWQRLLSVVYAAKRRLSSHWRRRSSVKQEAIRDASIGTRSLFYALNPQNAVHVNPNHLHERRHCSCDFVCPQFIMESDTSSSSVGSSQVPPVEVSPRAQRRRFSKSYKLRILEEADACTNRGEVGALLRREGLYASHLAQWRKQRERGTLHASTPASKELHAKEKEIRRLRKELGQTRSRLQKAEAVIEIQNKACSMFGRKHPDGGGTTMNEDQNIEWENVLARRAPEVAVRFC